MISNSSQLSSMPFFYLTLTGIEEILAYKRENVVKWFLVIFSREKQDLFSDLLVCLVKLSEVL